MPVTGRAESANEASVQVPKEAEPVAVLVTGSRLNVVAIGRAARFDIAHTAQAITLLVQCMADGD